MIQISKNKLAAPVSDGRMVDCASDRLNMVEAIGLSVFRGRLPILRDINLVVPQSETVAFMGRNGAGKSTLLKCLAGVLRTHRGRVCWLGNAVARSPFVRRQIGFVGHDTGLYNELSAFENLVFAGRLSGVDCPGERARTLLAAAGLKAVMHRPVGESSQGLRRRLAIARALIHEPRLILLDEPFASLDAEGRYWLEQLFASWRQVGRTVCFAGHDVEQSRALADRILWLEMGRIVTAEVTSRPPMYSQWSA